MLPSLTVAFLFGLLVGSRLPLFPISSIALLAAIAFGFALLERGGQLDTHRTLPLYVSLLSGVVYWSLLIPPPTLHPTSWDLQESRRDSISGRVVLQFSMGWDVRRSSSKPTTSQRRPAVYA